MSKIVLQFSIGLNVLATLILFISSLLPFHVHHWFLLIKVQLSLLRGSVRVLGAVVLKNAGEAFKDRNWSEGVSFELQESSNLMCMGAFNSMLPDMCQGMQFAYIMGLVMAATVFVNIMLNGVAIFLQGQYLFVLPKTKFREVSLILSIASPSILFVFMCIYGATVLYPMSCLKFKGLPSGVSQNGGLATVGMGYGLMGFYLFIMVFVTVLNTFGKTKEERMLREAKMNAEFEVEMACHQGYGLDPYATHQGYGLDPYACGDHLQQKQPWASGPQEAYGGGPPMGAPVMQPSYGSGPPAQEQWGSQAGGGFGLAAARY